MSQTTREAADKFAALKGSEVLGYAEREGAIIIVLKSGPKFIFTAEGLKKAIDKLEANQPIPSTPGTTVGADAKPHKKVGKAS